MSIWAQAPATGGATRNYRIFRTPNAAAIRAICISHKWEGVKLHFWKGRSLPCIGANCEPCIEGHAPRWKGYVLIKNPDSPSVVIYEFTERAHEAFEQRWRRYSSLRGCVFVARRTNKKVNGPLLVEFEEARYDEALLPDASDLRSILERIWEIRQQTLPSLINSDADLQNRPELRLA